MSTLRNLGSQFERWLFESYALGAKEWGLFRIVYALFVLLLLGLPPFTYLAALPDMYFLPREYSVGPLFSGYPDTSFFHVLQSALVLCYVAILFGYKTRSASIAAAILMVFGKTFAYSLGQINHDFMLWLVPLAGAAADWGNQYSLDQKYSPRSFNPQNAGWPITFIVTIFCFAMALSGYNKLLGGWASLDFAAVQQYWARAHVITQRDELLSPYFISVTSTFFWKSLDYLTLIFEIGMIAGIVFPRVFKALLFVAAGFHLSNLLLINIDFSFNFAFYGLFLNWTAIVLWFERTQFKRAIPDRFLSRRAFWILAIAYVLFFGLTENSLAGFLLQPVGVGYLGNALFRTGFAVAITLWALVYFLKGSSLSAREDIIAPKLGSGRRIS